MRKLSLLLAVLMSVTMVMAQKSKVSIASSALTSGKLDQAKEAIDEAMKDPSVAEYAKGYMVKGQVYQGIAESVLPNYKSLDADAAMVAYDAYLNAVKFDDKEKLVKKIKPLVANLVPYIATRGGEFFNEGKYKESASLFRQVLDIQKSDLIGSTAIDTSMIYNLGLASENAGDYETAIESYTKTKDLGYNSANSFARLSSSLKAAGKADQATKILEEGFQKYPNDLNIIFELINANLSGGTPEKAAEYVDKAIELDPKNASLYRAKGTIYEKSGDMLKAKELYQKAIEIDPKDYASRYNVAVMEYNITAEMNKKANDIVDNATYNKEIEKVLSRYQNEVVPLFEAAHEVSGDDDSALRQLKTLYYLLRERTPEMMEKYNATIKELGE